MKNEKEKKLKNMKLSAGLFLLASILFLISWLLSGFEESIWGFLGLVNMSSAISFWGAYQKEKKKIEEGEVE